VLQQGAYTNIAAPLRMVPCVVPVAGL
jgi:hypothetical protein